MVLCQNDNSEGGWAWRHSELDGRTLHLPSGCCWKRKSESHIYKLLDEDLEPQYFDHELEHGFTILRSTSDQKAKFLYLHNMCRPFGWIHLCRPCAAKTVCYVFQHWLKYMRESARARACVWVRACRRACVRVCVCVWRGLLLAVSFNVYLRLYITRYAFNALVYTHQAATAES